MTGFYCPFRIFGNGTKCHNGHPYRDFDIKEKEDECMAWNEHRCNLCYPPYPDAGRDAP